jgi:hypothetical protein
MVEKKELNIWNIRFTKVRRHRQQGKPIINGEPSIYLLPFFATQIIGGAKELVVYL